MKNFYKKYKNIINIIVLLIITGIVLYFSLKDDFYGTLDKIDTLDKKYLLLAFIMVIIYWILRSLALHKFTKYFKKDNKYRSSLQLMLRTQFFNAVTPFATGGQPYQIYYLMQEGIAAAEAANIIILNFIVYQIALVALGIVAVTCNFIFHIFNKVELLQHLVLLGFLCNTGVIVIMFLISFNKKINKKLVNLGIRILTKLHIVKDKKAKIQEWDKKVNQFYNGTKILLSNKKDFIMTIIYNLLALLCLYSIPLVLFYSMGNFDSVTVPLAVITSAYVMLIGSFVPIPGGSGGLEYSFMQFYGTFTYGSTLSAIMLLWRFVTYYFGMIVGAISLNLKRVK
jgi:hypothetical protein